MPQRFVQYWRDQARPIIESVLRLHQGSPDSTIEAALELAYPWGQREGMPYEVWKEEIARQRGERASSLKACCTFVNSSNIERRNSLG